MLSLSWGKMGNDDPDVSVNWSPSPPIGFGYIEETGKSPGLMTKALFQQPQDPLEQEPVEQEPPRPSFFSEVTEKPPLPLPPPQPQEGLM